VGALQLNVVEEFSVLLSLSDTYVYVHDLTTYTEHARIERSKGESCPHSIVHPCVAPAADGGRWGSRVHGCMPDCTCHAAAARVHAVRNGCAGSTGSDCGHAPFRRHPPAVTSHIEAAAGGRHPAQAHYFRVGTSSGPVSGSARDQPAAHSRGSAVGGGLHHRWA
jgi:hypothetical protein